MADGVKQVPGTEAQIPWDTEDRHELMPREAHIRDTNCFLTAPLLSWMEETWGGVLTHVRTATFVSTGEVWVARARPEEKGAVPINRVGTQNSGVFSFWRPLRKLNLKVPANRQFNVVPRLHRVNDSLTVFVFPMNERMSVPRDVREEAETQAATAQEAPRQG